MTDPLNKLLDDKEIHLPDWDMIDDWLHPDRAAIGVVRGIVLGVLFWLAACGIVALANKFIGGG